MQWMSILNPEEDNIVIPLPIWLVGEETEVIATAPIVLSIHDQNSIRNRRLMANLPYHERSSIF